MSGRRAATWSETSDVTAVRPASKDQLRFRQFSTLWGSGRSATFIVCPDCSRVLCWCKSTFWVCKSETMKRDWNIHWSSQRRHTCGAMRRQKPSSHHHIEPTCFHLQRFKAQTVNSHPLTLITLNLLMDEQSVQEQLFVFKLTESRSTFHSSQKHPLWNQTCAARCSPAEEHGAGDGPETHQIHWLVCWA